MNSVSNWCFLLLTCPLFWKKSAGTVFVCSQSMFLNISSLCWGITGSSQAIPLGSSQGPSNGYIVSCGHCQVQVCQVWAAYKNTAHYLISLFPTASLDLFSSFLPLQLCSHLYACLSPRCHYPFFRFSPLSLPQLNILYTTSVLWSNFSGAHLNMGPPGTPLPYCIS